MSKCWVYHETEEPIIVDAEEAQSYYDDGWKDSPRYFVKTTDFGVEPDDHIAVQQLGEAIEGVADSLNGALNIGEMDKSDLADYAETHFGKNIDKRKSISSIRNEIQGMIDGNG